MKKFVLHGCSCSDGRFPAVPAYAAAAEAVQNAGAQGVITPKFTYISLLSPVLYQLVGYRYKNE